MYKENCLNYMSDEDSKVAHRFNKEDQTNFNHFEKSNNLQYLNAQIKSIREKNEIPLLNTLNKDDHNENVKLLFNSRTHINKTVKDFCLKSSSLPPDLVSSECNNNTQSRGEINQNKNNISILKNGQNNNCDRLKVKDDSFNKFNIKEIDTVNDKITSIRTVSNHLTHTISKENANKKKLDGQSPDNREKSTTNSSGIISDSDESFVSIDICTEQNDHLNKMNNNRSQLIDFSGPKQVAVIVKRKNEQEDIHPCSNENFLSSGTSSQDIKAIETYTNVTDKCNIGKVLDANAAHYVNLTKLSDIKNKNFGEDSYLSQQKLPSNNKVPDCEQKGSIYYNVSANKQHIPTLHIIMNQNIKDIDTTVSMNKNSNFQNFKSKKSVVNSVNKKDYSERKNEQQKKDNSDDFVRDKSAKRKSHLNRSQNEEVIISSKEDSCANFQDMASQLKLTNYLKPNIKRIDRRSETLPLSDELHKDLLIKRNRRFNERKFSDPAIMAENEKSLSLDYRNNISDRNCLLNNEKSLTFNQKIDDTLISMPTSTSTDPNHVVSILKKKDCSLENEQSSNIVNASPATMSTNIFKISAKIKRFGILKKRTSLDDSGNLLHSHSSNKRNMLSELIRRNSLEETTLQELQQNQTHGILKQSSHDGSKSDNCASATEIHPHSILKKKDNSSTISISQPLFFGPTDIGCEKSANEELFVLEDSFTFTNDEHDIRPILKQESISTDETVRTPKPILKKKISGDLEEQEIRPILKTSRKSSREEFDECSFLNSETQRHESSVRPILKTTSLLKRRSLSSFESCSNASKSVPFLLNRRTRSLERHVIPFADLGAALDAISTSTLEVNKDELSGNINNSVSERVKYMESILNKNSNSFILPTKVKNSFDMSESHNTDLIINIHRRSSHRDRYKTQPVTFKEKIIFQEASSALSDLKSTSCNLLKLQGDQPHETNTAKSPISNPLALVPSDSSVSENLSSNKNLFSTRDIEENCLNNVAFISKMSQTNKDLSEPSIVKVVSKNDSENNKHKELIECDAVDAGGIKRSNSVRERANMFQKLQEEIVLPKRTVSQYSPSKLYKPPKDDSSEPVTEILNKTDVDEETDPSTLSLSERLRFFNKLESQNCQNYQYSNISTYSPSIDLGETSPAPNTSYCLQSTPLSIPKSNMIAPILMDCSPINKRTRLRNIALLDKKSIDSTSMCKLTEKGLENYSLEKSISLTLTQDVTSTSAYIPFTKRIKLKSSLAKSHLYNDRNNNTTENLALSPIEIDHRNKNSSDIIKKHIGKVKSPFLENSIRFKQEQLEKEFRRYNQYKNTSENNEKNSAKEVDSINSIIKCPSYNVDYIEKINMSEKINGFNNLNKMCSLNSVINKNKTCVQNQKETTRIDKRYAKFFGIRLSNMEQENQTQSLQFKKVSGYVSKTNVNFKNINLAYHCKLSTPYPSTVDTTNNSEVSNLLEKQENATDIKSIESSIPFSDITTCNFITNVCNIKKSKQTITAMGNQNQKNDFQFSSLSRKNDSRVSFTTEQKYNQHTNQIKKFEEIIISKEEFLLATKDFDRIFSIANL